ncbi:MAG TPA: hypothetical protein VGD40_23325, partial [Chryseosolibacter sp.]
DSHHYFGLGQVWRVKKVKKIKSCYRRLVLALHFIAPRIKFNHQDPFSGCEPNAPLLIFFHRCQDYTIDGIIPR